MQGGKQNRIRMERQPDGRGVSGETDHQLGRHPVGETIVLPVGDPVRVGDFRTMRVVTPHVHRIQGKYHTLITNNSGADIIYD